MYLIAKHLREFSSTYSLSQAGREALLVAMSKLWRAALDPVPTRLVEYVIEGCACTSDGVLDVSQTAIGESIGTSRSYVSTLMNRWQKKTLLNRVGRCRWSVPDVAALRADAKSISGKPGRRGPRGF
jgi:CRP-like cAMP-binding protein